MASSVSVTRVLKIPSRFEWPFPFLFAVPFMALRSGCYLPFLEDGQSDFNDFGDDPSQISFIGFGQLLDFIRKLCLEPKADLPCGWPFLYCLSCFHDHHVKPVFSVCQDKSAIK